MHEFSIAAAIVDTAVRHADGRRVTSVQVNLGHLRQVVPDSLEFAFGIVSRGTVCEDAALEQVVIPARLRCGPCDREWQIDQPNFRCPSCDGTETVAVSGEELEVESIDVTEDGGPSRGVPPEIGGCKAPPDLERAGCV